MDTRNPLIQLRQARDTAQTKQDPTAKYCTLTTIDPDDATQPRSRTLVIREITDQTCLIFVNADSKKNLDELSSTKAELLFFYPSVMQQFRVRGTLSQMSVQELEPRWRHKPYKSKLLDHFYSQIEKQSTSMPDRSLIDEGIAQLAHTYPNNESIPFSPNALGIVMRADYVEAWEAAEDGVHKRTLYELIDGVWAHDDLVP